MVIYFPQESLVVNQAAQGFEQQVLRARIEALRSSRPAGVWFTEGDGTLSLAAFNLGMSSF